MCWRLTPRPRLQCLSKTRNWAKDWVIINVYAQIFESAQQKQYYLKYLLQHHSNCIWNVIPPSPQCKEIIYQATYIPDKKICNHYSFYTLYFSVQSSPPSSEELRPELPTAPHSILFTSHRQLHTTYFTPNFHQDNYIYLQINISNLTEPEIYIYQRKSNYLKIWNKFKSTRII